MMKCNFMFAKNSKAYSVYLLFRFVCSLAVSMSTVLSIVYHLEVVQLDAFQLVLVGTVQETSCFLFEMPTGVVADLYSRRRSGGVDCLGGRGQTHRQGVPAGQSNGANRRRSGRGAGHTAGKHKPANASHLGGQFVLVVGAGDGSHHARNQLLPCY